LQYSEFAPLGDLNGNFVGTVGYENTVQITLGMLFPLQPLCVFTFKFPTEMKISSISRITGDGVFTPENGQSQTGQQYYHLNAATNTLRVTGCLNKQEFNA
jgi:hypothetical protein